MADDAANKPHPATPKKREEFRKEGQFPRARDTTAIATMGAVVLVVVAGHAALGELMNTAFKLCHGDLNAITRGDGSLIASAAPKALLAVAAPPAIAAAIAGAAAGAWQAGIRLYPEMLNASDLRVPLGGDGEDVRRVRLEQVGARERREGAARVRDEQARRLLQIERAPVEGEVELRHREALTELAEQLVGGERDDLELRERIVQVRGELFTDPERNLAAGDQQVNRAVVLARLVLEQARDYLR